MDGEHSKWKGFRFPDTSKLPTDPKALRHAVESNRIAVSGFNLIEPSAKRLSAKAAAAELLNILQEGNPMTPQLRAAIFNALAELPGVEVDTGATDMLGRQGYAIRSTDGNGGGTEFIFDPDTADALAQREFLPSGLTSRETAYIESGVVDSTQEAPNEGQ
jgi:hypothetical protein